MLIVKRIGGISIGLFPGIMLGIGCMIFGQAGIGAWHSWRASTWPTTTSALHYNDIVSTSRMNFNDAPSTFQVKGQSYTNDRLAFGYHPDGFYGIHMAIFDPQLSMEQFLETVTILGKLPSSGSRVEDLSVSLTHYP
jgi:hypothetical protein